MRQAAMLVLLMIIALWRPDVLVAQSQSPASGPTPAEIERPTPSAKATKNPHGPHHHFDVRHPHRSTRPQIQNPVTAPD